MLAQRGYRISSKEDEKIARHKAKVTTINKEILDKLKGDILPPYFSNDSNRDQFCDFTVVVGDTEFPCHRFVLSACSEFFEALLRSDMKERREMRVNIEGISPEIFKMILDIIYGSCKALVPDKMIDIWKAAHQLQIQFLIAACEDHFMKNTDADNIYIIYTHAQLLQAPKVTSSALKCMVQSFHAFVLSENFMKLDYEVFLQIIQNKNVPTCEDFKVEAILKWCEAANKGNKSKSPKSVEDRTRLSFLGNLFQAVDLVYVSSKCLATLLTNPFIQEDKTASSAINSQAAENLVNPKIVNTRMYRHMNEKKSCQHCEQQRQQRTTYDSDDSYNH